MILRLWLLLVLACAGALAPSRAGARGAENRTWDFFPATTESRQENEPQVAESHQGNLVHGYETASGCCLAAETTAARAGSTYEGLLADAQAAYPGKAGVTELHHVTPKYLGGAVDGTLAPLDAAYHQQITNEFRTLWPYGGPKPSATELERIMQEVYTKYPLPSAPVKVP